MRALAALVCSAALLAAPAAAQDRPPVLVELFTAQGCAACPEANTEAGALAEREDVVLLSWSVDYWDYLGWRDTLARPESAERQRAYMRRLNLRRLSTPQVIVGGREALRDTDPDALRSALDRPAGPVVDMRLADDGSRVWVGSGRAPRGGGEVWLIRYDPEPPSIRVRDGENRGREVRLVNAVREAVRLGGWRGRPRVWRLPPPRSPQLRSVVLLQEANGGPVLGVALPPRHENAPRSEATGR